jgi:26S proteasome regulatory subunit N6
MILDKVLCGVLDQGRGCLLVYEKPEADVRVLFFLVPFSFPPSSHMYFSFVCPQQNTYGAAIETLAQVGKVVESLYAKVSSLLFLLLLRHSAALAFSLFLGF